VVQLGFNLIGASVMASPAFAYRQFRENTDQRRQSRHARDARKAVWASTGGATLNPQLDHERIVAT